jgi:Icc-related predicted phosphoesterase
VSVQTPIVNIIGDTHNLESLKIILSKFNNVISLGDACAVVSNDILKDNNHIRYKSAWQSHSKRLPANRTDLSWFKEISIENWKKQCDNIKNSKKNFVLVMGNSDLAMMNFFPQCRDILIDSLSSRFNFVKDPELKTINNVQFLMIPFSNETYNLQGLLEQVNTKKKLFILTHCPALKNATKNYYINIYNAVEQISAKYENNIVFIHGHMHPSVSYKYNIPSLPNVTFYCPKAEENHNGYGINNHVITVDTNSGTITLVDSITGVRQEFRSLPELYFQNEHHWNEFHKFLN